jgi:hypothetical protein
MEVYQARYPSMSTESPAIARDLFGNVFGMNISSKKSRGTMEVCKTWLSQPASIHNNQHFYIYNLKICTWKECIKSNWKN